MKQLVAPNLNAQGSIGMCLQYAERVFQFAKPSGVPTATASWNGAKSQHKDMNFPTDVSVPIWFSYVINGEDEGHVAINVPGKGIYSSPWQQSTTHAVLSSVSQLISIYSNNGTHPMHFLGWSEDISGKKVVEGGSMAQITTEMIVALSLGTQGTQPQSPDEYAQWVGKTDQQSFDDMITHYVAKGQAHQAALEAAAQASYKPYSGPELFVKN